MEQRAWVAVVFLALCPVVLAQAPGGPTMIGEPEGTGYQASAQLVLPVGGVATFWFLPSDVKQLEKAAAAARVDLIGDREGRSISGHFSVFDAAGGKWSRPQVRALAFWPSSHDREKAVRALLEKDGLTEPRLYTARPLAVRLEVTGRVVRLHLDGRLLYERKLPQEARGQVAVKLLKGAELRDVTVAPCAAEPRFVPVDIYGQAQTPLARKLGSAPVHVDGVPFHPAAGGEACVDLRTARWIEWARDPADYYENYDGGPPILDDPRMPMLRVPVADYCAAHLLAVADDDPALWPGLTLRAGRYGWGFGQVAQFAFAGRVPRAAEAKADSPAAPFVHVSVPMTTAFAQDMHDCWMDVELTKELRLAVRAPDPCRWRERPLGPASGVRIAAVTFERSPLQMRVSSKESGHAFVLPGKPVFDVELRNITNEAAAFTLSAAARHLDGPACQARAAGQVPPRESVTVQLPIPAERLGYYDIEVQLVDGAGRTLLVRRTSFALLPPDTRCHGDQCPFGTWDFSGGHYTCADANVVGSLHKKMGLRYGMFGFSAEQRAPWGVLQGRELNLLNYKTGADAVEEFAKLLAKDPAMPLTALLMHENAVSGAHLTRVADIFTDRPPYKMNEAEQKRFDDLFNKCVECAKAMRERFPAVRLALGNGLGTTMEEFLRHRFPPELFDTLGNECAVFMRLPETQPLDDVGFNSSLWMDRQILDAYGYTDKAQSQCFEICYPCTTPGNLDLRTQADYFVRHGMHALAWGMPKIRFGCIEDAGNSYRFSNWGGSGLCQMMPELNVKPAFVTVATMTRALDGAKLSRVLPMGSLSLYGLEFEREGGRVYAFWTVRGRRPLALTLEGDGWQAVESQGNVVPLAREGAEWALTVSPSVVYLLGNGRVTAVRAGVPIYDEAPRGRVTPISSLADFAEWRVETQRDAAIETHNPFCPRRPGDFAFEAVAGFEGKTGVLRVWPRPVRGKDVMPMYGILAHKTGVPLPGAPAAIGLWINGNSGWGRPIFDLEDASGQRWTSIGASENGEITQWMLDWMPKEALKQGYKPTQADWNTDDCFGRSRINFDGWRYVEFPLPGQYPGEGYHWPANSQWRSDKDGIVHYPLTFRRLIIELPEKVLCFTRFAPPQRAEIYLKDLVVVEP